MNIRNIFLLLCLSLCIVPALGDEVADSVAARELEEVVVTGERTWIKDGVINVIPTKQEKKLSNSPATLIESMNLPFVRVKDGSVTSLSGESVAFFINGVAVNEVDLATFWPKNVTVVQYMESPNDPKYAGARYVINFKMHEYEVGGVTKIDADQVIPNMGFYTAASKLVYKKMTYGAMFKGNYRRDHSTTMSGETKYRDIYFDNKFYEEIIRNEESAEYSRNDGINFAVNARYTTEKTIISHTFSLGWDRNPGTGSHSKNYWSDDLFGSDYSSMFSKFKTLTPQFKGACYFRLAPKWHLNIYYSYAHAHTDSYTRSILGETVPVENSIEEDVNTASFSIVPALVLSEKWTFTFSSSGTFDWFSSLYCGSANTRQHQDRQDLNEILKIWWHPVKSLYIVAQPGVKISSWKIGEIKENQIYPNIRAQIYWNPSRKFIINGVYQLFYFAPSASESNPLMVKLSELMWTIGNPHLKGAKRWMTTLNFNYFPIEELSFNLDAMYIKEYDDMYTRYTPAVKEYGGLIQETVNAKHADNLHTTFTISGYLLNRKLNINFSPGYKCVVSREGGRRNRSSFFFSGKASYTIGNCRLALSYYKNGKNFDATGYGEFWKQDEWMFTLTYGVKDFYFYFKIENLFNNKLKSRDKLDMPNYSTNFDYLRNGRSVSINLTYTFGHGKKVDKSIDISGPSSTSSSIRGADK